VAQHGAARPAAVTEAKLRPHVFHKREGNQGHGVCHYLRALSAMVVTQYGMLQYRDSAMWRPDSLPCSQLKEDSPLPR